MTTMAEPEWDDETRELALGAAAVDLCPLCGNPAELCQSAEHEFNWTAGDPIRCHIESTRLAKAKGYTEDTHPQSQALLFPVRPREGVIL